MQRNLAKAVLFLVVATVSVARADFTNGLVGHWTFDGSGYDDSPNHNTLTLQGGLGYRAAGLLGNALEFPLDLNQFAIRSADDATYDFGTGNFTLQVWANFRTLSGEQTLFEKFVGAGGPGWTVTKVTGNAIQFYGNASPFPAIQVQTAANSVSTTNIWHQVVVRRNGSAFNIFLDGTSAATGSSTRSISDTTNPLMVGRRDGSQGYPMDGGIDELAIWNRALSNTEISQLYNGGAGLIIPEPSSLLLVASGCVALSCGLRRRSRLRL